jgi:hypothetical protein
MLRIRQKCFGSDVHDFKTRIKAQSDPKQKHRKQHRIGFGVPVNIRAGEDLHSALCRVAAHQEPLDGSVAFEVCGIPWQVLLANDCADAAA